MEVEQVDNSSPDSEISSEVVSENEGGQSIEPSFIDIGQYGKHLIEYPANGKSVKETLEMVLKRASQGYNYAQHIQGVKQQQTEAQQMLAKAQEIESRWKQFDDYAQQNPEWYQHWQNAWLQREQPTDQFDPNNPLAKTVLELKQQIGELSNTFKTNQQRAQEAEHDSKLDLEIKSIRSQHPDIDFDHTDEYGETLENRILKHAGEIGTKSFRAAFRDFYHDEFVKRASEAAKEQVGKSLQEQKKRGIVGKTQVPQFRVQEAANLKSKSYDDLMREGLEELRSGTI